MYTARSMVEAVGVVMVVAEAHPIIYYYICAGRRWQWRTMKLSKSDINIRRRIMLGLNAIRFHRHGFCPIWRRSANVFKPLNKLLNLCTICRIFRWYITWGPYCSVELLYYYGTVVFCSPTIATTAVVCILSRTGLV